MFAQQHYSEHQITSQCNQQKRLVGLLSLENQKPYLLLVYHVVSHTVQFSSHTNLFYEYHIQEI